MRRLCDVKPFARVDLRGDVHHEPIGEVRRVFDASRPATPAEDLRQVDARVPPLDDWLREHAPARAAESHGGPPGPGARP